MNSLNFSRSTGGGSRTGLLCGERRDPANVAETVRDGDREACERQARAGQEVLDGSASLWHSSVILTVSRSRMCLTRFSGEAEVAAETLRMPPAGAAGQPTSPSRDGAS